ncbi:hypothetical protein [Pedobacter aquatilis]|uniref:hypothetical protein n=1 Tax=Pedobacter aquatilis TaxID=351343 RepID=UPI0029307431|nr:hypothetical protein [Pedobacter aquatilis]
MKNLITLLLFTVVAFSAYAGATLPKETESVIKKEFSKTNIKTSRTAIAKTSFRKSSCFIFHDSCGQTVTIYVSGANHVSEYQLWLAAYKDFEQHTYADGCY